MIFGAGPLTDDVQIDGDEAQQKNALPGTVKRTAPPPPGTPLKSPVVNPKIPTPPKVVPKTAPKEKAKTEADCDTSGLDTIRDDFKQEIHNRESKNNNYDEHNREAGGIGAIGRYQLRKAPLTDAGFIDKATGTWTGPLARNTACRV